MIFVITAFFISDNCARLKWTVIFIFIVPHTNTKNNHMRNRLLSPMKKTLILLTILFAGNTASAAPDDKAIIGRWDLTVNMDGK
jgi:hypothetical protein